MADDQVTTWLLDSDPAIRWQVMRDVMAMPDEQVRAERSRVAEEGWGCRLLDLQTPDGLWGGGEYHPYWTSTTYTLLLLRDLGVDPTSPAVRHAIDLVREEVKLQWTEEDSKPFFEGEIETCINGMVTALGAYFGEPSPGLVDRLLDEQLADGGWNCWAGEAWPDEETDRSSFHTTMSVIEGLLEYEGSAAADAAITEARSRGEEYLLERRLFRRRSTGEIINPTWALFSFPTGYKYDILRGLEHLRNARVKPDERITEALDIVARNRDADGRWPLQNPHPGEVHFELEDGPDRPSRWNTLRAMRVLKWAGA